MYAHHFKWLLENQQMVNCSYLMVLYLYKIIKYEQSTIAYLLYTGLHIWHYMFKP